MDIKTVFHVENQNIHVEIGAVFEDVDSQFQDVPATGASKLLGFGSRSKCGMLRNDG